jgi:hypothetical protein
MRGIGVSSNGCCGVMIEPAIKSLTDREKAK